MNVTTTTGPSGMRTIRSVNEIGTIAMAIENRREGGTYWALAPVQVPSGVTDPVGPPYPELDTEELARVWVTFLGELINRACGLRPVWCPHDARQTAADAAEHESERGAAVSQ